MRALPFSKILEEAVYAEEGVKKLSGSVRHLDDLLNPDNIRKLESLHRGPYGFLAFHPAVDRVVQEYLDAGTVGLDAGSNFLVLFFCKDIEVSSSRVLEWDAGIEIRADSHPAYEFIRTFEFDEPIQLPGLVIFDRLVERELAVYVTLSRLSTVEGVAELCRRVFAISNECFRTDIDPDKKAFDMLCVKLKRANIEYVRLGAMSFREWLLGAFRLATKYSGVIGTVVKMGSGAGAI